MEHRSYGGDLVPILPIGIDPPRPSEGESTAVMDGCYMESPVFIFSSNLNAYRDDIFCLAQTAAAAPAMFTWNILLVMQISLPMTVPSDLQQLSNIRPPVRATSLLNIEHFHELLNDIYMIRDASTHQFAPSADDVDLELTITELPCIHIVMADLPAPMSQLTP